MKWVDVKWKINCILCEIKEENNQQQLCRLGRFTMLGAVGKREFRQIAMNYNFIPVVWHQTEFTGCNDIYCSFSIE